MTAPSNANTSGLEVVAWRWETPIPHVGDGTKWGWSFASHWSTPPSSLNAETLVTAASAQARIAELEAELSQANANGASHWSRATAAEARADRLAAALKYARYHVVGSLHSDRQQALDQIDAALQQETQK